MATIAIAVAACGSDEEGNPAAPERGPAQGAAAVGLAPDADVEAAEEEDVRVIGAWIAALSESDITAAAELFAIPSVAENGFVVSRIRSRGDAVAFNDSLPCGGELIRAATSGEFTTATFRLADRPGSSCGGGAGGEATTSFVVSDGEIVEWRRVGTDRDEPGGTTT